MNRGLREDAGPGIRRDPNVLISFVASAATAALVLSAPDLWSQVRAEPMVFGAFVALTIGLQLCSIEVYGRGSFSFVGAGMLAVGFTFGVGAAMAIAALMGLVNLLWRRGRINRGVFDAAQFALSAGAGTLFYERIGSAGWGPLARTFGALGAGAVFTIVNVGLLCLAISLADGAKPQDVWRERFRWLTPYYLAAGVLGLALTVAYEQVGLTGLLAFTLPPAMMMFSTRMYVQRTKESVEEIREKNEELRLANTQLEERNEDLQALFQFAGGLAARSHDTHVLTSYAESALATMTGARAEISVGSEDGGIGLMSGGQHIGALHLAQTPGFEGERWARLHEAIVPQLATAIESAVLVEEVRKKHLETIAALARSMEAKDYYTGGHTERVSDVSVALAKRLGFAGTDLDAIEIGALLHDIGKIGIPERILHKPGPLDDEEWKVMKEHPVISEYILSEVDLHPFVTQIARHSHERMDGAGYPDGLTGEAIPMPARIVLVADALDALTSDRPYRRGRSVAAAIEEMQAHAGTQFCPQVVSALQAIYVEEPHVLGAAHLRAVGGEAAA